MWRDRTISLKATILLHFLFFLAFDVHLVENKPNLIPDLATVILLGGLILALSKSFKKFRSQIFNINNILLFLKSRIEN